MKNLRPERVRHALHNIHNWAISAKFQGTTHIEMIAQVFTDVVGAQIQTFIQQNRTY